MPARSAAITQRLVEIAALAAEAGHGRKDAVYAAACAELGMSRATLMRGLADVTVRPERRRRSDAGKVTLTRADALLISAELMESHRKNSKQLFSIGQAVETLRANGWLQAERVDAATGEIKKLSNSAVARALRRYGLHPDQLLQPEPCKQLRSLHPNHVWQIDASLCVLYYLKNGAAGLQVMNREEFYKNKPANLARIENERVWRYAITDHFSGAIFVFYVLGSESGINLANSFIEAIQKREGDPFHGVPLILMMDMGSANTSGLFKNLARRLQVKLLAHAPGNARATGQVENAHNLIERSFESGLKFKPVGSLDELNALARTWVRWYNGTKVHSRHGKTRYDQWMTIAPDQLRIPPSIDLCRALLTHEPEGRTVTRELEVEFKGAFYSVSAVPNVMIGEKLRVTYNPYQKNAAVVVDTDADGNEVLHTVPVVAKDAGGFREDANTIDQDYTRHAVTRADQNRKEVNMLAMDAATPAEAKAKRKAKQLPFGGRLDAFKLIEQHKAPDYLPRRGTELPGMARTVAEPKVLDLFETTSALLRRGVQMTTERHAQIAAWYPNKQVPESDLDQLQHRLTVRAGLRVVGGGSAE